MAKCVDLPVRDSWIAIIVRLIEYVRFSGSIRQGQGQGQRPPCGEKGTGRAEGQPFPRNARGARGARRDGGSWQRMWFEATWREIWSHMLSMTGLPEFWRKGCQKNYYGRSTGEVPQQAYQNMTVRP